jgi:hypothetical protein
VILLGSIIDLPSYEITTPAPATNLIRLYPNPATNYLYVRYPTSPNSAVLKILDMLGLIIKTNLLQHKKKAPLHIESGNSLV